MADYVSMVSNSRRSESGSLRVGDMIDSNQTISTSHPVYRGYTDKLKEKLTEIITRESEKYSSAPQAVCSATVDMQTRSAISKEFPEFRIIWAAMATPVHSEWVARRLLLNQIMMHEARSFASSFVHYGGSALSYITAGVRDVHLLVDSANTTAMHESHTDDVQCAQLMSAPLSAAKEIAWFVQPDDRKAYLTQGAWMKSNAGAKSFAQAEALIVDGGLYSISPSQFMAAMFQHGAGIGYVSVPYHPSMLLHADGTLPGTAIEYSIDDWDVHLKYPHGVAGVTTYSTYVWHQWLMNTTRQLEVSQDKYEFELMGVRGCFMIVRVVHVGVGELEPDKIVHSLQIPQPESLTMVKTWRIKSSVSDVTKPSAWEEVSVTVPTSVVTKTIDFAMGLQADQFSRYAIRKRLMVVNNRVVVQGTSVDVNEPVTAEQADILEIAIFTRCFVMRYESGRLSKILKNTVDECAKFGSLSFWAKMSCVLTVTWTMLYDWTVAAADGRVRSALDAVRRWVSRKPDLKDNFLPVPHFIRYEHIIQKKAGIILRAVRTVATALPSALDLCSGVAGYDMMLVTGLAPAGKYPLPRITVDDDAVYHTGDCFSDIVYTGEPGEPASQGVELFGIVRSLNEVDQAGVDRHDLNIVWNEARVQEVDIEREDYVLDPGYINTMREAHEAMIPGLVDVDFTLDPASIALDDQDRTLAADYMRLPSDFGGLPSNKEVFLSNINAYGVLKRQGTVQETLSALAARNLSAPVVAVPQDIDELVHLAFENFLDVACVPEARDMLEQYSKDPVALEEDAFFDWTKKARPEVVQKVIKYLLENPDSWEEFEINRYEVMPKADVKPPLSDKPIRNRIEPQVIVHHMPVINAIFSSIFRVIVRRFVSLLKPNFMLNLLKDMPDVRNVMQVHHPWGAKLKYLENDFSKYDKSQGFFVSALETYVYRRLGMNQAMLERWRLGHVESNIRSLATGISLSVRYQRKSGDATTSFGNGLLNMISVLYVYKGTDIAWAVFMGDDSLICARTVVGDDLAVRALGEQFNLLAKFYITNAPYFASNFVLINDREQRIVCIPDPIKRIQKWSMAIPAKDPKWEERYVSARSAMAVYMSRFNLTGLGQALSERYSVSDNFNCEAVGDALATAVSSFDRFRAMWSNDVETIAY